MPALQTHIHTCAHIEAYTCGLPDTPRQALCCGKSPLNALQWVMTYTVVFLGDFTAEEFHLFIRSLPDLQRNPKSPSWISLDKGLLPRVVSPCTYAFIFRPIFLYTLLASKSRESAFSLVFGLCEPRLHLS